MLLHDPEDLINKPVGTALREIGRVDTDRLLVFLTEHTATMPRATLRLAVDGLPPERRAEFMAR